MSELLVKFAPKIATVRTAALVAGVGVTLGLGMASASAAGVGLTQTCTNINPNRWQCTFPVLSASSNMIINYASMQCGSTGTVSFSLQEFQVLATPAGSTNEIAYQIPIANRPSVGGVVDTGSPVTIYVKTGSAFRSLIDLSPAPNGTNQCSVSISAN